MKIVVICMGRSSVVKNMNGKEVIIYSVDFGMKFEKAQTMFGSLHLESTEPFHYKEKKEYSIMLSELVTLASPLETNKLKERGYGVKRVVN